MFKEWQQKNQIVILNIEEEKAIDSIMLLNQSQIKNISNDTSKANQAYNQSQTTNNNLSDDVNRNNHDEFIKEPNVKININCNPITNSTSVNNSESHVVEV